MAKQQRKIIGIQERVPLSKGIPLSIQHTFAMFSASVLVPYILGINPSIALLMNGIGTFIFIICTKGKAPAYLGSSFAFISPALLVIGTEGLGYRYALGGFVVTGLLMCAIARDRNSDQVRRDQVDRRHPPSGCYGTCCRSHRS